MVVKLIRAAQDEGPHVFFSFFFFFRVVFFFLCDVLFFLLFFFSEANPLPKKLPGWKRSVFTARSVSTYETSQKEFFFSFQRLKMET